MTSYARQAILVCDDNQVVLRYHGVVVGDRNVVHGVDMLVVGDYNDVAADFAMVFGRFNTVRGVGCLVHGDHNLLCHPSSAATGHGNRQLLSRRAPTPDPLLLSFCTELHRDSAVNACVLHTFALPSVPAARLYPMDLGRPSLLAGIESECRHCLVRGNGTLMMTLPCRHRTSCAACARRHQPESCPDCGASVACMIECSG